MSLIFAHRSLGGVPFKNDSEAPHSLGVHLVVDHNLGLIVCVDISF